MTRYTLSLYDRAVALYDGDLTLQQVAAKLTEETGESITYTTVYRWFTVAGKACRKSGPKGPHAAGRLSAGEKIKLLREALSPLLTFAESVVREVVCGVHPDTRAQLDAARDALKRTAPKLALLLCLLASPLTAAGHAHGSGHSTAVTAYAIDTTTTIPLGSVLWPDGTEPAPGHLRRLSQTFETPDRKRWWGVPRRSVPASGETTWVVEFVREGRR